MEASERPMESSVTEGHPSWYVETSEVEPTPGAIHAFRKHVSGGAVVAGALVALAAQLMFIAFGTFLGVGAGAVGTIADLSTRTASTGIWIAASAAVATFIGGYMAARLAGTSTRSGLWHGLTTWGLLIIAGVVLGLFGLSSVLGFGISSTSVLNAYIHGVAVAPADATAAASIAGTLGGWFIVGALASLVTAVLGGYMGVLYRIRMARMPLEEREEHMYRRAA